MGNWFVYPTCTDLGKAVANVKISINGSPERTTGSDGRCELSKNTLGDWGKVPNGDFWLKLRWQTLTGEVVRFARLELHSNRADLAPALGVIISNVEWWGTADTWVRGTKIDDQHWVPSAGSQADPYQAKIEFYVILDGGGVKLYTDTLATIITPAPEQQVTPAPTPTVPTVPVAPVTTPTAEAGMYTLRCGIVKLPNFDSEKASAFVESDIAPTVAVVLQPLGYTYTGHVDNWEQNYFDLQFTGASPPIPLAVIIAAIAVIGIVAAALLVISLTWYKQAAVQEQIQQNLTDLLNQGKITPQQYLDATGAQQQAIASGTAGWMGGLQQVLTTAAPLIIVVVIGFIVLKAVPERKVIEEKKAPPVTPEVLAH